MKKGEVLKTVTDSRIIYTKVDEAPALATYSLLPIIRTFTSCSGVVVETRNISLSGRILALFPDFLSDSQRKSDDLTELGELVLKPEANIIKLPNISASVPQLKAAINELQKKGYKLPDYPEVPQTEYEIEIKSRYDKVKGSAVNPVLRQGNSDRRAPVAVKSYVRKHPHRMGEWTTESKSHVSAMEMGDFYANEKSVVVKEDCSYRIYFEDDRGSVVLLKSESPLLKDELIDASFMSVKALRSFLEEQMQDALNKNILFSVHLKATMMKISDPILFGHVVSVYFKEVFDKHKSLFENIGIDSNNGLGDLYNKIQSLPRIKQEEIKYDIKACYQKRPSLAMIDSDKGITSLHVPNDVIIDASMPAFIRASGKMWGPDGKLHDTKAVIPDRSYAGVYQKVMMFCKSYGAFDPKLLGSVPNVGLMAQRAEEYGSHDKTFKVPTNGVVRVVTNNSEVLIEHNVEEGDVWRMCQTKDAPIRDWVKLAVKRARLSNSPAVFWLDEERAHDRLLISKVNAYLKDYDTVGLKIHIMSPVKATRYTLERFVKGKDTISVTGNVLRDYLTDLFPIIELGTSAKMLSIVPLMNGGGVFETGAGGSAPKHVQQFEAEGHLRWDSLGEYMALAASLEHLSQVYNNDKARVLSETLDKATAKFLENDKSPSRKVNELDNRGSHFYLAMYWAQELALQDVDKELKERFCSIANELILNETIIMDEINAAQGKPMCLGGYYMPNDELAYKAMRPSTTFNAIIDSLF